MVIVRLTRFWYGKRTGPSSGYGRQVELPAGLVARLVKGAYTESRFSSFRVKFSITGRCCANRLPLRKSARVINGYFMIVYFKVLKCV